LSARPLIGERFDPHAGTDLHRGRQDAARFCWLHGLLQRHNILPLPGRFIID
jgi:hypothetical protein